MSASRSASTATPAPNPAAMARMLTAYALLFFGTSSAATTPTRKASATPMGRASVWVTTSTANVGAIAPSTDSNGASQATATMTRRRPMRSARIAAGRAITIPTRTKAPAMPIPVLSTPKSSAAKLTVWVNSVLTKAALIEAAASRPSTSSCV